MEILGVILMGVIMFILRPKSDTNGCNGVYKAPMSEIGRIYIDKMSKTKKGRDELFNSTSSRNVS